MRRPRLARGVLADDDCEEEQAQEGADRETVEDAEALCDRGSALAEQGQLAAALREWARGLELETRSASASGSETVAAASAGKRPELLGRLHEHSAQVLMELEEYWRALAHAERSVVARPDWHIGLLTLARARRECGEVFGAQQAYHSALRAASLLPAVTPQELQDIKLELAEIDVIAARLSVALSAERASLEEQDVSVQSKAQTQVLTCQMNLKLRCLVGRSSCQVADIDSSA